MGFDIMHSVLVLYSEDKSTIFIGSVCTVPPGYSLSTNTITVFMYLSPWDRAIGKLIVAHLIRDFAAFVFWNRKVRDCDNATEPYPEPVESIPHLSTASYLTRSLVV